MTKTRALSLDDIELFGIPIRKVRQFRDGGSWAAEVHIDGRWASAAYDIDTNTTTIDGKPATVKLSLHMGGVE